LIEKYCTHGTGWNPGEYAYILKEYQDNEANWKDQVKERLATPLSEKELERGHEYAAYIINALMGGEMFKFNGNVPNTNLVTNLPQGACVEVPVFADKAGFHPVHVGALPPECALLTQLSSGIEELAIQAALTGDPVAVYRAIAHDPLTAAVLSLAEIKAMVNEMFQQNRAYLPQFDHLQV
jgi:alpha-galactosidase